MGAGQSTVYDAPQHGLHVLRVTPSSPASYSNIEPFFDFVVGFEGDTPSSASEKTIDAAALEQIVESHENRTLTLLVWNSKSRTTRAVAIVPSRAWSQQDQPNDASNAQPSLLGLSMRLCQLEAATDNVWHVLDVLEGSPAESAGLVPMGDWILGWSGGALAAENDFYDLVEAHVDKPLRVYVYSYDFDTLREVVLIPNRHWGGEGLLGCIFGFGLLHRIPPQPEDRAPGSLPEELQEQGDEYGNQDFFVPADVEADSEHQHTEWRRQQEQEHRHAHKHEQWNSEVSARSTHSSSEVASAGRGHIQDIHHHDHDHSHDHSHSHSHSHDSPSANGSPPPPRNGIAGRLSSTTTASAPNRTRSPLTYGDTGSDLK